MTEPTIDQERDALLPKIESDQRELAAAVAELRTASADFGVRAAVWIAVGLLLAVAAPLLVRGLSARWRSASRRIDVPAFETEGDAQLS
jgi:hypothetical protein